MTRRPVNAERELPDSPDEATSLVGQVIDQRYRVTEVIGEGGMGRVYRAEHAQLARTVAIKVLHPATSGIPELARRFGREALALARLDHPNCVSIQDFGALPDGSLYLVMSHLSGVLLRHALVGGMPPARALHIARHVLAGLAHAHHLGIVHRDIKSENVMLVHHEGDPDFAKIFDFGIAKLAAAEGAPIDTRLTRVGQQFGTPAYMSPEQALGKPVDHRADLYSLTVVLFEALTGRLPFESEDGGQLLVMHGAAPPPTLAERAPHLTFIPELEALVRKGLAKQAADRYATAIEYIEALDVCRGHLLAIASTVPVAIARPPASLARRLARRVRSALRTRRGQAIAAGATLLVAVVLALVFSRGGDHAARARHLLAAGKPEEAVAYLEKHARAISRRADAQLELGHAYAALRRYDDALTAYRRARDLAGVAADDRAMRTNLILMLGDERGGTAAGAARFLVQVLGDEGGRARLVELASRHPSFAHRTALRDLAEEFGLGDRIDRLASYRLDLRQGPSCADRERAVAKLRALGDPAAIPALTKAKARKTNACLRGAASDAITYLEARSGEAEE